MRTLNGLHICNFNPKAIKKSTDVENEMNNNLLQSVPVLSHDPSCVTVALLNVRSIIAKLPDIRADSNLRSASVLCFCETWLNAAQPSPMLIENQVDIRCDRVTCENKGGVLMCVPSHMTPFNVQRFAVSGIEVVSATVKLPRSECLQIATVYRSPSVPQATLITLLRRLLAHLTQSTTPSIVVGDFNEDLLHNPNSALVRLMESSGFTQLVKCPTTPQGTMIDHAYYKDTSCTAMSSIVNVQDTYYSDHDTLYCSIPL